MAEVCPSVETLRKPSTGLKPTFDIIDMCHVFSRDTQKTQHGIETGLDGC